MRPLIRRLTARLGLLQGRCPVCGVLRGTDHGPLCPACARDLRPRTGGYCPRCGLFFGAETDEAHLCSDCRLHPRPWDRLHFHGRHDGALRELILAYKFSGGLHLSRLLQDMALAAFERHNESRPDLIVPVPLHRRRLLWRGYNQSLELARRIATRHNIPLDARALVRTRNTVPQTRVEAGERRRNIRDAFRADAASVAGKSVLLVDDVLTTGATLEECAKTLHKAGSSAVDILILSVAQE
ncbi:ComF family protein [Salidesulfovibrio onnuriiensis]|uniref:ComF family protein n=1 Tax=Salidesulfovibrio onnuriiensis TaxID=2583823 RepID=UPI0011CC68B4|nr:ComF family protein [Salidesulfovibrio onnuriiensis]